MRIKANKMIYTILFCIFCVMSVTSYAQRPSKTGKLLSHTEGGVLCGNSDNENSAPFIFHSALNYAFHKNLSAGAGIGFEFLKETYLPVTANVLYQFGDKKIITPFVRLLAGYQVPLENNTSIYNYDYKPISLFYDIYYPPTYEKIAPKSRGGLVINPSVGVIVYTRIGLGISLSAGYRYQRLNYSGDKNYALHIEYNRLSLTLGIIF